MPKCKITVLKRTLNIELAKLYVKDPKQTVPCPTFSKGQEFIISDTFEKPAGFCDWAWSDLFKGILTLSRGGDFSQDAFDGWMNDKNILIACCTEGIRPVIFKIERIHD